MRRLVIIAALGLSLSACASTKEYFTQRFLPSNPGPIKATIERATAADVNTEIAERMAAKKWTKAQSSDGSAAFTKPLTGIIAFFLYQTNNSEKALGRYQFTVTESTSNAAVSAQFFLVKDSLSAAEPRGGKPQDRLRDFLKGIKQKLEARPLPPVAVAP